MGLLVHDVDSIAYPEGRYHLTENIAPEYFGIVGGGFKAEMFDFINKLHLKRCDVELRRVIF